MEIESGIKAIEKIIPFLAPYETWVKCLVSLWILITATIVIGLLFGKRTSEEVVSDNLPPKTAVTNSSAKNSEESEDIKKWEMTGDEVIDNVLKKLNVLEKKGTKNISQIELVSTLRPLFTRPAFYGIREESWEYFLYPLCKTRTILEFYTQYFDSPKIRINLHSAIKEMVILQNDVAKIYGVAFSVSEHMHKYLYNNSEFINNMPNREFEPDYKFFDERDKSIRKIRAILNEVGLSEK